MDHGKPIIYVKNVRKVYRMGDEEVVALKRINLRIYKGEVCCIRNVGVRKEYAFESTGRNGETHKRTGIYPREKYIGYE